jgi:hypothetical protein
VYVHTIDPRRRLARRLGCLPRSAALLLLHADDRRAGTFRRINNKGAYCAPRRRAPSVRESRRGASRARARAPASLPGHFERVNGGEERAKVCVARWTTPPGHEDRMSSSAFAGQRAS